MHSWSLKKIKNRKLPNHYLQNDLPSQINEKDKVKNHASELS